MFNIFKYKAIAKKIQKESNGIVQNTTVQQKQIKKQKNIKDLNNVIICSRKKKFFFEEKKTDAIYKQCHHILQMFSKERDLRAKKRQSEPEFEMSVISY